MTFAWRRLGVLVRYLPAEASVYRSVHGDLAQWGTVEHLLASIVDVLQAANWQRGGNKHAKRPQPIPRPGVVNEDTFKPKGRPLGEMRQLLEEWNAGLLADKGYRPKGERRVM